jgi:predicted regulator of Ras-like GTPase activity (Roadblock/LC7/MglB family)
VDAHAVLLTELRRLRHRLPGISGTVLSGIDGQLLATDLPASDLRGNGALPAVGPPASASLSEPYGEPARKLRDGVHAWATGDDRLGIDANHVAALAAASLGISHRFTHVLGHGPLRESVIQGMTGCVIACPAGEHALLAVVGHPEIDVLRLCAEARAAAQRCGHLWDALRRSAVVTAPVVGVAPTADPHAPLAVRTPMATLAATLWSNPDGHG